MALPVPARRYSHGICMKEGEQDMKKRDIGAILLIGLVFAGLQAAARAPGSKMPLQKRQRFRQRQNQAKASGTKSAEDHTWQFTYFGTSTDEKTNTMAAGGSWKTGFLLLPAR